jgi:predicted transcriptional regulator
MDQKRERPESKVRAAKALSNEVQAWELRTAGYTFAAIGTQLGLTEEGARQAYLRGFNRMDAMHSATLAEEKRMMLHRNDTLRRYHYARAQKGDIESTKMYLALEKLRAEILGLDQPFKLDVPYRLTKAELEDLDAEILELSRRVHEVESGDADD